MGLDMYLRKKHYVKNWSYMGPEELHSVTVRKGGKIVKEIKKKRISHVVEEVACWRKANAIHKFFVDKVQKGVDECQESYVDAEQLKDLLDRCKTVLEKSELVNGKIQNGYTVDDKLNRVYNMIEGEVVKDSAVSHDLLPSAEGFFFGSTEYDEYYIQDIQYTIEILEAELDKNGEFSGDYYYQSSW